MENLYDIIFKIILILILIPTIIYLIKKIIDLKSSNLSLQKEVNNLESQKLQFENKISDLESKIIQYEDKKSILSQYQWDEEFGTWKSKSEPIHYICNSCINKMPLVVTPLQKHKTYYECTIKNCNQKYVSDKALSSAYKKLPPGL